jgi:hypothetical protein
MYKAYGNRILIQSHATTVSNRTNKDIIPPISLEYDCCGSIDKNFKLNELRLHIPLRIVAGSHDDLRIASHKIEDVEKLILEQEWKVKNSTVDSHLSFLSYVGMATTGLTLICFCFVAVRNVAADDARSFQNGGRIIILVPLLFSNQRLLLQFIHLEKV